MTFRLKIDMGNAAFDGNTDGEVARILKQLVNRIEQVGLDRGDKFQLHDVNGNTVGTATVSR